MATLSEPLMRGLLDAISDPRHKPNDDQVATALEQLAEAAAAIIRAMPINRRESFRLRFEGRLGMALERKITPNDPDPEEE